MSVASESIRTPVVAGNWKMHKDPAAAAAFVRDLLPACPPRADRTVVLFPPALAVTAVLAALGERDDIGVGVQNVHWEDKGAFTGEIAATMAAAAGCRFALVGHSERRHLFAETDEQVRLKTAAVLRAGLTPVVCLGETLEQRRAGRLQAVILGQLDAALSGLEAGAVARLLVAYEPVWAIGTGVNATPADAAEAHGMLRRRLVESFGAGAVPILYGGSVKPDNAAELLAADDVDGLLVGGASLDAAGFARIAAS